MNYLNADFTGNAIDYRQSYNGCELEPLIKPTSDKETKDTRQKPRILVVEDELINQTVARMFLKQQGYEFDIVSSGETALALFISRIYTAILMDVGLPGIDGLETTRRIRNLEHGSGKHIPIIALTANGMEYKTKCLDAGMDDFSIKPFKFSELSLILKGWIKP